MPHVPFHFVLPEVALPSPPGLPNAARTVLNRPFYNGFLLPAGLLFLQRQIVTVEYAKLLLFPFYFYPFTPPAVRPDTIYFCIQKKIISTGTDTRIAAAENIPQLLV